MNCDFVAYEGEGGKRVLRCRTTGKAPTVCDEMGVFCEDMCGKKVFMEHMQKAFDTNQFLESIQSLPPLREDEL